RWSQQEAFENELLAFHAMVTRGAPAPSGLAEGRADLRTGQRVLAALARRQGVALGGEAAEARVAERGVRPAPAPPPTAASGAPGQPAPPRRRGPRRAGPRTGPAGPHRTRRAANGELPFDQAKRILPVDVDSASPGRAPDKPPVAERGGAVRSGHGIAEEPRRRDRRGRPARADHEQRPRRLPRARHHQAGARRVLPRRRRRDPPGPVRA